MRKLTFSLALTLMAVPLFAAAPERTHSFFTYDDGGTVIKQGEDGREIEARVNLPVFPGDEITTSRRGRAEIRLADGNIIALDRATTVRFVSILDSYDGDNAQTIVELRSGHVAIERDDDTRQILRLDTQSASYAATDNAIYAVEAYEKANDRVVVLDGAIEVRTPARTIRIRQGEEAKVDDQGVFDLASERGASDDFERWFAKRSNHYRTAQSRYLDRSLAYYDDELAANGTWQYVSAYNSWAWRPRVGSGWRPYYYGDWVNGPSGCLVWASYEPWGWVPYHYGRWAYDAFYGWVWLPGLSYAPAWVYWMYGPSYVGWAPMGWYDCFGPYYDWAYRPYSRVSFGFGYGWYGRVHVPGIDLRPWTFVQPNHLVSHRVDQAALSTEIVRNRLLRGGDGAFATVSSSPARFSRDELKDPTAAIGVISRRGIGSGTGKEGSGVVADMTPFFRRDPELSNTLRERVARSYRGDSSIAFPSGSSSGVPSPGTGGTLEGRVPTDQSGRVRSETGQGGNGITGGGIINRGGDVTRSGDTTNPAATAGRRNDSNAPAWRERVTRPVTTPADQQGSGTSTTVTPNRDWRGRSIGRHGGDSGSAGSGSTSNNGSGNNNGNANSGSEVPRRIIDTIGGGRVYSGDRDRGGSTSTPRDTSRDSSRDAPRAVPRDNPPPRDSGSSSNSSSHHDSGGGRVERSSPPPPPEHSSPPPPSSSSSSSSRSSGDGGSGRVRRN
jgi:hypothetical protein